MPAPSVRVGPVRVGPVRVGRDRVVLSEFLLVPDRILPVAIFVLSFLLSVFLVCSVFLSFSWTVPVGVYFLAGLSLCSCACLDCVCWIRPFQCVECFSLGLFLLVSLLV